MIGNHWAEDPTRTEPSEPSTDQNLFLQPHINSRWNPKWFFGRASWKILSGEWHIEKSGEVLYRQQPDVWTGENISVIGSTRWNNYRFETTLSILDDSIKPPEGGAILYYHYANSRNYCSFHVCAWKHKLEVIKRLRGVWSTVAEKSFLCRKLQPYHISITTIAGSDRIQINGETQLEIQRPDVTRGCVGIGVKYCNVAYSRATLAFPDHNRTF